MSKLVPHSTKTCTPGAPCNDIVPCLVHVSAYSEALLNTPAALAADLASIPSDVDMAGPEVTPPALTRDQERVLAMLENRPRSTTWLVSRTELGYARVERVVSDLVKLGRVRMSEAMLPGVYWERV